MNYLATFHNDEDNMTSLVYVSRNKADGGGFVVALRDDDIGKIVTSIHGFKTVDAAIAKAQEVL